MIEDKKVVKTESVLETLLLDMSNQMNRTRDLSYEILTKSNQIQDNSNPQKVCEPELREDVSFIQRANSILDDWKSANNRLDEAFQNLTKII